jgi:uncharacterized protein YbjT (DUF2867 family)
MWRVMSFPGPGDRCHSGPVKPQDGKILVLGATGSQGGAVARELVRSGFSDVHALARSTGSSRAPQLAEQGIALEAGELDDSESVSAAMRGAYGVFCVLPLDQQGQETEIRRGRGVAYAAERAGVQHFIYSSVGGADRSEGVAHFHTKYVVEEHIRSLSLPASIVRPAGYMDNFATFERPRLVDGVAVFRVPIHPQSRRQMIAASDIGMVVADMFTRPGDFLGTALEIAGDELTGQQVTEEYTRVTGQPARYEVQPIDEVRAYSPEFADMYGWLDKHGFGADIGRLRADYPRLTTFAEWLSQHRDAVVPQ